MGDGCRAGQEDAAQDGEVAFPVQHDRDGGDYPLHSGVEKFPVLAEHKWSPRLFPSFQLKAWERRAWVER